MEEDSSSNASTRYQEPDEAVPDSDSRRRGRRFAVDADSNNITVGGRRSSDRKIQRVSRACDACKLRKSRCSGTNPCRTCVRKGLQCLYLTKYGRGRPPTPIAASPIFSPVSNVDQVPLGEFTSTAGPEANAAWISHGQGGWPETPRASTEGSSTNTQSQYHNTSAGVAFLRRAWKRLSAARRHLSATNDGEFTGTVKRQAQVAAGDKPLDIPLRSSDEQQLIPKRSEALNLFESYFKECIATYRFLHKPTVEQWLLKVLNNNEQGLPHHHDIGESRASIILGILAMATYYKHLSKPTISREEKSSSTYQSDQFFASAIRQIEDATGFPDLESVQARMIQVLYLLGTARMNQAWYMFGRTLDMMTALGLHRFETRTRKIASRNSQPNYISSQCEKRLFWVSYILDQYLGVLFGRPRHYHDDDIDQTFPDCVDDEHMTPEGSGLPSRTKDCLVTALVYHVKITKVLGHITRAMYSAKPLSTNSLSSFVSDVKSELYEWKMQLPPFLGAVNPSSLTSPFRQQATALRLAYSHAVIHATRPFLLASVGDSNESSARTGNQISECISSARLVLETVDAMAGDNSLFPVFWWTHYVTFCALAAVYLWEIQHHLYHVNWYNQDYHEQLLGLAERCQTHLAETTASNSPGRRYSIILQELRAGAKQAKAGVASHFFSLNNGRSTLEQNNVSEDENESSACRSHSQSASGAIGIDSDGDSHQSLWNNWQTIDWLEIDSLVFNQSSMLESTVGSWYTNMPDSR